MAFVVSIFMMVLKNSIYIMCVYVCVCVCVCVYIYIYIYN